MPIEIRELIIKAQVIDQETQRQSGSREQQLKKEELIEECIDQVLEILKQKQER